MASIESIWDEPAEVAESRPPADPVPESIEDIFGEVADLDDTLFDLAPLPQLDIAAEQRKAKARHNTNWTSNNPVNTNPSSSQPNGGDKETQNDGDGKEDAPKRATKQILRLDENRLLGPNGFSRLINETKDFKLKGKGHKASI